MKKRPTDTLPRAVAGLLVFFAIAGMLGVAAALFGLFVWVFRLVAGL